MPATISKRLNRLLLRLMLVEVKSVSGDKGKLIEKPLRRSLYFCTDCRYRSLQCVQGLPSTCDRSSHPSLSNAPHCVVGHFHYYHFGLV